jgi:hypothetical protein
MARETARFIASDQVKGAAVRRGDGEKARYYKTRHD